MFARVPSLLLLLLAGCAFISDEHAAWRLDPDGDGVPVGDDCDDTDATVGGATAWHADADGDGYGDPASATTSCAAAGVADATDCDDGDAGVHPGTEEACNGADDDCDGEADPGLETTWYADADGDGWGVDGDTTTACTLPNGYAGAPGDCDDGDAGVHPEAAETCDDADEDCDGEVDEAPTDAPTWYADADEDGYGVDDQGVAACDAPEGHAASGGDCDDGDPRFHPGADESDCGDSTDYNCDGSTGYADADGDGWAACEDCDDGAASIHPEATETCDDADEDCDGEVDDAPTDAPTWYADADGDGYGDAGSSTAACDVPVAHVADATDCDDADAGTSPGADELCGGGDEDCDGTTDEDDAADAPTWYADADGDGHGGSSGTTTACTAPEGYAAADDDCDDADARTHPGADESVCDDPTDYNCDGATGYADADGDGWASCEECDDSDAAVNPDATETCDGVDDDCDGTVDEDDAADTLPWYADADGDGFGGADAATLACEAPFGHVADATDCDDADGDTFPGAAEVVGDEVDQDCDDAETCYTDDDDDGYVTTSSSNTVASADLDCDDSGEATSAEPRTDCDDGSAADHPGATETVNNGDDEDCDGGDTCYVDADVDGYGTTTTAASADLDCADAGEATVSTDCADGDVDTFPGAAEAESTTSCRTDADGDGYGDESPAGGVTAGADCDDASSSVKPGASELVGDEVDQDCDDAETCYTDADNDGYVTTSSSNTRASTDLDCDDSGEATSAEPRTDCDDADAADHPGATETVNNGDDEDCDGGDTCYVDADVDGYGTTTTAASADLDCADAGEATVSTDCDDADADTFPGAAEAESTTSCRTDADGDGYGEESPASGVTAGADCDDASSSVKPGASEVAGDEVDQDCDDAETCYTDVDNDGYVTTSSSNTRASTDLDCDDSGEATSAEPRTDCDDADADTFPGAASNDSATACMNDDDGDDWGDESAGSGVVAGTDCDDADSSIEPGASEVAGDEVDQDCDDAETCYADADNDGYVTTSASSTRASVDLDCDDSGEASGTEPRTDCDDGDADTFPGAASADSTTACMNDDDGDNYGDATAPAGGTAGTDCDDASSSDRPGATETVNNGDDEDCDGGDTCYDDADADGYGTSTLVDSADLDCADAGEATVTTDCDDSDATVSPGAAEVCGNGVDDDCDGGGGSCVLAEEIGLASADARFIGDLGSRSGMAIAGGGDLDGDGLADLVVGAPAYSSYSGLAVVVLGARTGTVDLGVETRFTGGTSSDAGLSVAIAPDLDGDGLDDLVVGAHEADWTYTNEGVVYVVHGPASAGGSLGSSFDLRLYGASSWDGLGRAVDGVGDYDGDGTNELVMGAPGAGSVYVVDASSSTTAAASTYGEAVYTFEDGGDYAGYAVAGVGDTDGDGLADVLVGAPNQDSGASNAGAAYLVLGGTGFINLSAAEARLLGESADDSAGYAVDGAGDTDGDGYRDLLVGAPYQDAQGSNAGAAHLILGPVTGSVSLSTADATLEGQSDGEYAGYSVAGAGDVDGDGFDDVLVGAPYRDTPSSDAGAAFLNYGPLSGTIGLSLSDVWGMGEAASDYAGSSVAGAGDVDGDGFDDVLIGADGNDEGGSTAGATYLLYGTGI